MMRKIIKIAGIAVFAILAQTNLNAQTVGGEKGQVVFYSQADLGGCSEVEVTVFNTLEEYFGTSTLPAGGGILGTKSFGGVFPNQEATCDSEGVAVFNLPPGQYYYEHVNKNCFEMNGGNKKYPWRQFTVVKGECTKIRLTR